METYNHKRIVLFINPHFVLGGVDTYFFRMTKWLRQKDMRVILLLPENGKVDEGLLQQMRDMGAEVHQNLGLYPNTKEISPTHVELNLPDGSDILVITTKYFGFFEGNLLRLDYPKCHFTYANYLTHMLGFRPTKYDTKEKGLKALFGKIRYQYYKNMSAKVFKSKEMVFMNDVHRYKYYDFYKMPHSMTVGPNILLGMEIPELDEQYIEHRLQKKNFTILTVSRYEFPFKGYMIDLLEQFADLCEKHDNLELVVIGWGPHEQQFMDKLHSLPETVQKKVKTVGPVPYEKLDAYFKEASVYVGHATTILDAGKTALPVLTTGAYTMECNTDAHFFEQIELYSMDGVHKTKEYLEQIINMSQEEYRELSLKTYRTIKDNYDMDVVMPQVLSVQNTDNRYEVGRIHIALFKWIYTNLVTR